jgi:DNA-binding MarR family transcriptional regulator
VPAARAALEQAVSHGLRALMARSVVRSHQVAEHTGLNPTDLQCLGLLQLHGPLTAGALARATGLTTSAITAVADRLERSGFARREQDPADRRRVILRANAAEVERTILPFYEGRSAGQAAVLGRFSDAELGVVRAFLEALSEEEER